jgi:hypothetical protein
MRGEKRSEKSDGGAKRRLQVTVEVDDPEVVDLFLRFKNKEVMPSNAATGLKIFTTLLRSQRADLLEVEPASR